MLENLTLMRPISSFSGIRAWQKRQPVRLGPRDPTCAHKGTGSGGTGGPLALQRTPFSRINVQCAHLFHSFPFTLKFMAKHCKLGWIWFKWIFYAFFNFIIFILEDLKKIWIISVIKQDRTWPFQTYSGTFKEILHIIPSHLNFLHTVGLWGFL